MPPLAQPNLLEWTTRARLWRRRFPTEVAENIAVEDRRASPLARAAFWVALRRDPTPGLPESGPCDQCGWPTYAWCEGCYVRLSQREPFSTLCQRCDQERLVCQTCDAQGITWHHGHQAYEAEQVEDEEAVEISGWGQESGPPTRITLSELVWLHVSFISSVKTQMLNVWYIYLHLPPKLPKCR